MEAFAKTDIGKARDMNQDFYYISPEEDPIKLFILADGMGGYRGGEVASRLATASVIEYIKNNFDETIKERHELSNLVRNSVLYANKTVYEKGKENEELQAMGTTLEVCLVYNNRAYIAHIGDSRIYRLRANIFRKLTIDDSYVEKLVKDGTITKEEAVNHPKKNMLTKALGCSSFVEPNVMVKGFQKDDIIFICSDGLTNMISEEEIHMIIKQDYKNAAMNLINKANENGGYDNITAVIVKM